MHAHHGADPKVSSDICGSATYVWAGIHASMTELPFLVDSGAPVSLIPQAWYDAIPAEDRPPLRPPPLTVKTGGKGVQLTIAGVTYLPIKLAGMTYELVVHVCSDETHGIIGTNFMERYDGIQYHKTRKFVVGNREVPTYTKDGMKMCHRVVMAKTAHVAPGERYTVTGMIRGRGMVENHHLLIESAKSLYQRTGVMVARVAVVPRGFYVPVEVCNFTDTTQTIHKNQTLGVASAIIDAKLYEQSPAAEQEKARQNEQGQQNTGKPDLASAQQEAKADPADRYLDPEAMQALFVNKHDYVRAPRNDTPDSRPYDNNSPKMFRSGPPPKTREETLDEKEQRWTTKSKPFPAYTQCKWKAEELLYQYGTTPPELNIKLLPFHMREVFVKVTAEWKDPWEVLAFYHLLDSFHEAFAADGDDLGHTDLVKHHMDTGEDRPFKQKLRRFPLSQTDIIKETTYKLADKGIVRPSTSPYGSNVLLVKKKDGTWRMCIDYRQLNSQTKNQDPYPVPRTDATLDALGGAQFFCTLDLLQGYHQVELTESSKPKTAFLTPCMTPCQWEYNYLPYGVTGGPATFMRVMDCLLHGLAYRIALAYMDDIIVFAATRIECMNRLAEVFNRIIDAGLKLKASKCTFFQEETAYLGHVITKDGVKCDPAKVEAVRHWKTPTTKRQVLEFCGFANYYNRFIKGYSETSRPLYQATRKAVDWAWTPECDAAFEKLRNQLINAPTMAYPLPEGEWILDTDASGYSIGAVLAQMQKQPDGSIVEKVISYGSRTLNGAEQRYCTRRRELLAVANFVKHFRPYIYLRHVTIRTDHASLRYIKTMNNPDDQSMRWIMRLEETYYTIQIRQ